MRTFTPDYPFTRQLPLETSPLIKVSIDGSVQYEQKTMEKVELLKSKVEGDKFYMPIPWKYRTDVFELTQEDIASVLFIQAS